MMGRFADASWWWEYGLDGLIGGIAGGVVAWGAVWLTLRGTRRQGDTQAAELAVARLQAAGLHAMMVLSMVQQVARSVNNDRLIQTISELAAALAEARVRVLHRWPAMATDLEKLIGEVGTQAAGPGVDAAKHMEETAIRSSQLATAWLENPGAFTKRAAL